MTEKIIDLEVPEKQDLATCHLMPCRIEHKGLYARTREYFWPLIKPLIAGGDDEDGRDKDHTNSSAQNNQDPENPTLTSSFRGRPLQGKKVKLPEGYRGFIIGNDSNRDGKVPKKKFDEFTYWNWDELPTKDDATVKALQWITIANAIHGDPDV